MQFYELVVCRFPKETTAYAVWVNEIGVQFSAKVLFMTYRSGIGTATLLRVYFKTAA